MTARNPLRQRLPGHGSEGIDLAVNRGLAAAMLGDFSEGVAIMRKGGVPLDVVARILVNPDQRRESDWQSADTLVAKDSK